MAGVCAALASARTGADTVLVHDRPVLGGNASSEIRMHVCGADTRYAGENEERTRARETGIIEELRIEALANNPLHSPSGMDLALYNAVRSQTNLRFFLNAYVVGCEKRGSRVESCTALETTSGRTLEFTARQFVDATGDGALAYLAGAQYMRGRESKAEFGESLASEKADNCTLGHTIMFQTRDTGSPVPYAAPDWATKIDSDADLPHRGHSAHSGFWWIEWGGTMDTITQTEDITRELVAAALGIWDHMKNSGGRGFENYQLDWIGFLPGRRESRRFVGDYILTERDVLGGPRTVFPDQIAYGGWPIDTHPPLGFRSPDPPCEQTRLPGPYQIPLRSCCCKGFDNLFTAGRHISATHVAFCSTRVMGTCAAIGHGVGIAAALAARGNLTPREIAESRIEEVQQTLLKDGAYLLGITNRDPNDLARTASVTALSELPDFEAVKINDSWGHPEPELGGGCHAWRSGTLPAWIQMAWDGPVEISEVRLVLDTDFDNRMALTQDPEFRRIIKPVPREITLKDFRLIAFNQKEGKCVAEVKNNYQRLVVLRFPKTKCSSLRLECESSWGAETASVLEIRAYR